MVNKKDVNVEKINVKTNHWLVSKLNVMNQKNQIKQTIKLKSTYNPPLELFNPKNIKEWIFYIKKEANKNLDISI